MRQAVDLDPRHSNYIRDVLEKLEAEVGNVNDDSVDFDVDHGDELLAV